ncbi:MAG: Uma2 family endonuclease [Lachnospiraceae bacterium]|nr:Uma2 family endonuclease [Lachnospiraceae bacterium]
MCFHSINRANPKCSNQKGSVTIALALAQEKSYTIDDIYSLPDGERGELIDGHLYYMAPPSRKHQRIAGELFATIREYINSSSGSYEVDIAPFAVFLNADNKNYVEPDISVICDSNKLTDKGCLGAPDWIIEIVSPSSRRIDYLRIKLKFRITFKLFPKFLHMLFLIHHPFHINPLPSQILLSIFDPFFICYFKMIHKQYASVR